MNMKCNCLIIVLSILFFLNCSSSLAIDPQSAAFSLAAENKNINNITEVKKVEDLIQGLEKAWNNHDFKELTKYFSDDFVNGDGLKFEEVKNLTEDLWAGFPDIKTSSQERLTRVYGDYATVNSTDIYQGTTKTPRAEVDSKGILKAVSVGEVFLKKFGPSWKITSDKTLYEKVTIAFGIGNELVDQNKIRLSAPEQVISGKQYTARLEFDLPSDVKPVAAITKELLIYPQVQSDDKFRLVDKQELERLFSSNKLSKNELITATVGLTGGPLQPKLLGLLFLSRRVNIIPISSGVSEISIIKEPAKSALNQGIDLPDTNINDKEESIKQNNTKDNN